MRLNELRNRYKVDKVKLGSELGTQSFKLDTVRAYKSFNTLKENALPR